MNQYNDETYKNFYKAQVAESIFKRMFETCTLKVKEKFMKFLCGIAQIL